MARHFLIDTDTASDDAVALVMAMQHPDVHVEAITVVAGNVPVDQGVQNALYTVELCGQAVPVHRGMPAPLTRPLETAQFVHGQDGMGDIGLPLTGRAAASADAIAVLRETRRTNPETRVLLFTGSHVDPIQLGADDYVSKPCRLNRLCQKVAGCLENSVNGRMVRLSSS